MFAHLHNHTEYSMLDGLSKVEMMVERCSELGMDSLAITDHGGLYGAIDFYQAATAAGVKPIIGCELYVALNSRFDRAPEDKERYHLTALAKNETGYSNLLKLVSEANLEGYYYKPRVDRELLEKRSEGLIILSGCPSGEVPGLVAERRMDDAKRAIAWHRERFPEYHLELMRHDGVQRLPEINAGLIELSRETGTPVVATNDSHYTLKEHRKYHDILLCIQTGSTVKDEGRLQFDGDTYYLRSPEEMAEAFADLPEAVENAGKIADLCDLSIDFSQMHLPRFELPKGVSADDYLRQLCEEGMRTLIPNAGEAERQRLDYELDVIRTTRYATYFLVVSDIAQFARRNHIEIAVRGSAAASLALYFLRVTDVNPLTYSLAFERFLNIERKEMPDVDLDFQDDRREEALNYVVKKYGREHVAQIITFGTLGAKASVRDVGRALAMPYSEVDRVARLVPNKMKITLDEALNSSEELREVYEADPSIRELVDTAKGLEGVVRHSSTHAAGVVMSRNRLVETLPLQSSGRGGEESVSLPTTQYAMDPIAKLGLLKIDFLGLINLTILAKTRELIQQTRGVDVNHRELPLDDLKTYELLSRGETGGVFQLESAGMTRNIRELKPSNFNEIASMIALFRPGPMEHIGAYIAAKHGRAKVEVLHDDLRDILEETYGVIVFQEQVLQIMRRFAGYSLGQADVVRKAMGKKDPAIMREESQRFIAGALERGYERELAERVISLIEPFAGYAFNKAHSVCYALISYWTAYFKANYEREYMACLLNAFAENADKVVSIVSDCRRLRIPILPPDIISSQAFYSIEKAPDGSSRIRAGLATIKNVGTAAIEEFVAAREDMESPPATLDDFCRDADLSALSRKAFESLISVGALDRFGDRGALLASLDRIISFAESEANRKSSNQSSMFDMFSDDMPAELTSIELADVETSSAEKGRWEEELLGFALSGNEQLDAMIQDNDGRAIISVDDITPDLVGGNRVIKGQVSSFEERTTKNGKRYLIVKVALLGGNADVFVWEDMLATSGSLWEPGALLTLTVSVRAGEGDRIRLSCQRAEAYSPPAPREDGEEAAPFPPAERPAPMSIESEPTPPATTESPAPAPNERQKSDDQPPAPKPPAQSGASSQDDATPAVAANGSEGSRELVIRLREGENAAGEREMLDDVKMALVENRGRDSVSIEVVVDGSVVTMEWPMLKVAITENLIGALKVSIGELGDVRVEERAGASRR